MDGKEKDVEISREDDQEEAIFSIEEIKIEEMAIDGICGVY
jgi:mycofactocin precursor